MFLLPPGIKALTLPLLTCDIPKILTCSYIQVFHTFTIITVKKEFTRNFIIGTRTKIVENALTELNDVI